jgi:mRNA interferase HigB
MVVIGTELVERYFASRVGHKGVKTARSQYVVWFDIVGRARWRQPQM